MKHLRLEGVNTVIKNLKLADAKIMARASKGLSKAAQLVKVEAMKITPVEDRDLRNSAYGGKGYPVTKTATGIATEVGFSARHAAAVHEMPGTFYGKSEPRRSGKGNMWDTTGQPGFLRKAFAKNVRKVRRIIARSIKI